MRQITLTASQNTAGDKAAGLATADDVGNESIGLAVRAQVAIVPAWLGLCWVLGFSVLDATAPSRRFLGLLLNIATFILASLVTYALIGVKASALKCFKTDALRIRTRASDIPDISQKWD